MHGDDNSYHYQVPPLRKIENENLPAYIKKQMGIKRTTKTSQRAANQRVRQTQDMVCEDCKTHLQATRALQRCKVCQKERTRQKRVERNKSRLNSGAVQNFLPYSSTKVLLKADSISTRDKKALLPEHHPVKRLPTEKNLDQINRAFNTFIEESSTKLKEVESQAQRTITYNEFRVLWCHDCKKSIAIWSKMCDSCLRENRGIEVKTSTLSDAGVGLFVTRDFKAGECIGFYTGQPLIKASLPESRFDPPNFLLDLNSCDTLDANKNIFDPVRYINHSDDQEANVTDIAEAVDRSDLKGVTNLPDLEWWRQDVNGNITNKVEWIAKTDIRQGSELFIDYGSGYWDHKKKKKLGKKTGYKCERGRDWEFREKMFCIFTKHFVPGLKLRQQAEENKQIVRDSDILNSSNLNMDDNQKNDAYYNAYLYWKRREFKCFHGLVKCDRQV